MRERHPMTEYLQVALEGAGLFEAYEARPPYQMLDELAQGDVYMKMAWNPGRAKGEG
jgi:hypothetical protein